jgi:hypothetical protein
MLRFRCPKCGQDYQGNDYLVGTEFKCTHCKTTFTVPNPATAQWTIPNGLFFGIVGVSGVILLASMVTLLVVGLQPGKPAAPVAIGSMGRTAAREAPAQVPAPVRPALVPTPAPLPPPEVVPIPPKPAPVRPAVVPAPASSPVPEVASISPRPVPTLALPPEPASGSNSTTQSVAPKLPEVLNISDSGSFVLDSVVFEIYHITDTGMMFMQHKGIRRAPGFPHIADGLFELSGVIPSPNGTFEIHETLRATGPNAFSYDTTLHSAAGLPTKVLALHAILPAARCAGQNLVVDGAIVALPQTVGGSSQLLRKPFANKALIPTPGGMITIEGPVDLLVQDDRRYNVDTFTVRLYFAPSSSTVSIVKDAKLKLKVSFRPTKAAGSAQ